jgi:ABC-type sugar transport system ATPase subunit
MTAVSVRNAVKSYGMTKVIHDISLDVNPGEFLVFVGPSGCGKSTLLRMIAGLESFESGTISIDDEVVNQKPARDRDIAMVFQEYALYPHMSVEKNMGFGLKMRGVPKHQIASRVGEAARILQIEPLLARRPRELSGGQRQRVAMGRAIVRNPKVFLFDEPLSNLDAKLRIDMRTEIKRLHQQLGATMVYVTHDQVEAMTMADRIVVLNHGRIEQIGAPRDLYRNPTSRFVAGFIGSPTINFIKCSVEQGALILPSGHRMALVGASLENGAVELGIRPEHLKERQGGVAAVVELVEPLGADTLVTFRLDSTAIMARLPGDVLPRPGETLNIGFDLADALFFNPSNGQRVGPVS